MGVHSRILSPGRRDRIEAEIENHLKKVTVLVARLDLADGDWDLEPDEEDCCAAGDDDPGRVPCIFGRGDGYPGDLDDAEDDDPEEDDDPAEHSLQDEDGEWPV